MSLYKVLQLLENIHNLVCNKNNYSITLRTHKYILETECIILTLHQHL